jgi:RNA-binding protein PNO1
LVPPHRYTPLKENWELIYEPLVEQMGLQVRMNVKKRTVELRVRVRSVRFLVSVAAALSSTDWLSAVVQTSSHTVEAGALVKGADFVRAFVLGFEVQVGIFRAC